MQTENAYVVEGTEGSELIYGLVVKDSDHEIIKTRYSAFFKTDLEEFIYNNHINTLIICGINTHACVRQTAIDAYMRDLEVIIAKDCVASWDQIHHDVAMRYFEPRVAKVLTNEEIMNSV